MTWKPLPSGACHVVDATVTVKVTETLPEIKEVRAGENYSARKFREAIRAHENGHRDIAIKGGRAIEQTLQSVVASNCQVILDLANAAAKRTLQEYRAKQLYYDNDTQHGLTQGTALD
jgi:predicted secreted Zn-dependent protease